ncbi:MAG TPA: hypothetical protein PKM63_09050 [Panacibacter sp.]|nr:hypothetical protein [Panacibacter sp.]HNP44417.1 hypothetical protein [Panacibacter sp.]
MAGYSLTPLKKKLGISDALKVLVVNIPADYMSLLDADISKQLVKNGREADLIHIFAGSQKELEDHFLRAIALAKEGLIIWISWYKKASGIKTDITEDKIRSIVLPKGWVDVKVCAVSDIWSGLKIVKRKTGTRNI